MRFKVRLTREVEQQLREIVDYIALDSVENARRWRSSIRARMRSLQDFPERHQIVFTADLVGRDVRHTFYGVYRILYTIEADAVVVLSVRHGARRPLTPSDIRKLG